MPRPSGPSSTSSGDRGHVHHVTRGCRPGVNGGAVWGLGHTTPGRGTPPARPRSGLSGARSSRPRRTCERSGAGRPLRVAEAAPMEHRCRQGGSDVPSVSLGSWPARGLRGPAGRMGSAGPRLARARRAGEPGGAIMRPRPRAWRHPDPGDGAWGHAPMRDVRSPRENGSPPGRGVFDKFRISQGSSARRLVIEATYSL